MTDDAESLSRDLDAARERLLAVVAGVSEQDFKRRPPADAGIEPAWCIAEVLAHLLFMEHNLASQIELALANDAAALNAATDEEHREAALKGRTAPVPQIIHGLLGTRRDIERVLDKAGTVDGGLERSVVASADGRRTVAEIVRDQVIGLEVEYASRIEAIKTVLAEMKAAPG